MNLGSSNQLEPSWWIFSLVISVICFISIDNYFSYHEPSAISLQYQQFYNLTTKQFGSLFTIYSAPNVILVFFSGRFIDSIGLDRSSLFFNSMIFIGMLIPTTLPSRIHDLTPSQIYITLLISRFFLGLGGESICACVSTMISRWFGRSKFLNTAMALNQASVQILGSAAAFHILPQIDSIPKAQWITLSVCTGSLISNMVYNAFDYRYRNYLNFQTKKETSSTASYETIPLKEDLKQYEIEQGFENSHAAASRNPFSVLREFPFLFWLLMVHIGLVSPILYTFTAFGPMYLRETFPSRIHSDIEAGSAISLLYMFIVTAPITGMIIDHIGHRSYVQLVASGLIPLLFVLLTFDYIDPKLCMGLMGIIFSITKSNALALISITVPSHLTATGFGLYSCFMSIALFIEPAAVGLIREQTGSFAWSIWIFISLTLAGTIVALYIVIYDNTHQNILSRKSCR